jgi:hypothetical protein
MRARWQSRSGAPPSAVAPLVAAPRTTGPVPAAPACWRRRRRGRGGRRRRAGSAAGLPSGCRGRPLAAPGAARRPSWGAGRRSRSRSARGRRCPRIGRRIGRRARRRRHGRRRRRRSRRRRLPGGPAPPPAPRRRRPPRRRSGEPVGGGARRRRGPDGAVGLSSEIPSCISRLPAAVRAPDAPQVWRVTRGGGGCSSFLPCMTFARNSSSTTSLIPPSAATAWPAVAWRSRLSFTCFCFCCGVLCRPSSQPPLVLQYSHPTGAVIVCKVTLVMAP